MSKSKKQYKSNVRFFATAFDFMEFCLVMNEQDIDEFCGMYECNKDEFPRSDANAYVSFTNDKTGQDIAVLVLKEDAEQPLSSILGLIVHECVHIKQQIMENIGEDKPSSEFEAYLTQELATTMIDEYFRRSKIFKVKNK